MNSQSKTGTITAADATANPSTPVVGSSLLFAVPGFAVVAVVVSGTYAGVTLIAEGTVDGSNWVTTQLTTITSGAAAASVALADNSTTAFYVPNDGFQAVRIRATARTSGTVTATYEATATGNLSLGATAANQASSTALLQHWTRNFPVTPSDSTDTTTTATKGFFVGVGGDVATMGVGDSSAVTFKNMPSGFYMAGAYKRIMATNTTATNIISFYGP